MEAFRLVKARYDPLDPEGARRYGGRWNSRGTAVLYAADTIALAMLEKLVHLHRLEALAMFRLCTLQLPDEAILPLAETALPPDWQADPPTPATQAIGDQWVREQASLALTVPSVLVPRQRNLLINPTHPDFPALREGLEVEPFQFDPRLIAR